MADREKVIRALEICTTRPCFCKGCPYIKDCALDSQQLMVDALALLREQKTNGWVSVKDRLPESGTVCLTYSPKGKMRVAEAFIPSTIPGSTYDPMECWWQTHGGGGPRFVAVTHWMPLPEPPQEVSENGQG